MIIKENFPVKMKAVIKDIWEGGRIRTVDLNFNEDKEGFFYSNGKVYEAQEDWYAGMTIVEYDFIELIIE